MAKEALGGDGGVLVLVLAAGWRADRLANGSSSIKSGGGE